jgi:iron complex transport system substrate-binding protein
MQTKTVGLAALVVLASLAAATGPAVAGSAPTASTQESCSFPYGATDATGTEVTVQSEPSRVVSLSPSAAQTMWEIGAKEKVVGVSQYAAYLDGAGEKANVSGANGPSVERVLAQDPDLVLVPNSTYGFAPERVAKIRAQGVPVYVFGSGTSLSFVANKTERIGRLTGACEGGLRTAAEMRQSVRAMREALDGEERPVGLNYFYGYTSGSNTFIGDVMETAGLRNGGAEAGISGFKPVNDETVVEMDPAWIVVPDETAVPDSAAFNSTAAVTQGNVVRVNTNYLQQPAPRSVDAAETIMAAVHPEAYEEYRAAQNETTTGTSDAQTTAQADTAGTDATQTAAPETEATTTATPAETTGASSPGFGLVAAATALAAAALVFARR